MPSESRASIARSAAAALERAPTGAVRALVGFDGFIDEITDVVDYRRDMTAEGYARLRTIEAFAARVAAAAGRSANIELVVRERRFGGNGPLLATSLARLGAATTYIGAVGRAEDPSSLDPLFAGLGACCERVAPIAAPGLTRALEFDDGKLMFNDPASVQRVTWDRLVEVVGLEALVREVEAASVIGIVNWTLLGGVEGIWRGLMEHVLPRVGRSPGRRVFIDLTDPAKRTDADLRGALALLARMDEMVPVTLGLNLAEAERVSRVLGVDAFDAAGNTSLGAAVERAAAALRERLGLACVVIHPREGAGAAAAGEGGVESAWFEGPFTASPRLSTGAGDHFNGGFAFAQSLGLPVAACLAVGTAVSGAYVRDAGTPSRERVVGFLRELPEPEAANG